MIVDTNEPFLLDFREGVDIICVTLEGAWLRRSLSRLGTSTLALNTDTLLHALTANYIGTLAGDMSSLGGLDELASEQLTALLIAGLRPGAHSNAISKRHADLVSRVRALISAEIADPGLGAKRICSTLGVSRGTLFEAFAAEDFTLAGFIRKERLSRSKDLLRNKAFPIERIAHELGFRDHSSFSRSFKRELGVTPTTFRSRLYRM